MRQIIVFFFIAATVVSISAQNHFEIGLGRYDTDINTSNLSIHASASKSINNWLNIEGNLTINTIDKYTAFISGPVPGQIDQVELKYESYQFSLMADLHLFSFNKNTFQTHLKVGPTFTEEDSEVHYLSATAAIEEVVKIDNKLSGVLGYSYSFALDEIVINRIYFGVRRTF